MRSGDYELEEAWAASVHVKITVCSAGKQLQQRIAAAEAGGRHGCNVGRVQQAALPRCFFGDGDRLCSSCCNVDAKSDGGRDDDDDSDNNDNNNKNHNHNNNIN